MSSPVYEKFGGQQGQTPGAEQDFVSFMNQMRGQNPNAIINQMVKSGRLSQSQLDAAQKMAQQKMGTLSRFMKMFGF